MSQVERLRPMKYRSIWISDVHLGFRGCQAEFVLDFLQSTECRQLYLVGDIVDLWAMKNGVFWPQAHNNVVRAILDKARNGTEVIYVPGNHDDVFRTHLGSDFGNVMVRDEVLHTTADGRRFLVMHGDKFDRVVQSGPWLAKLGARLYDLLLGINHRFNAVRRRLGFGYWSLAAFLKHRVKDAVNYIGDFENAVAEEARRHGVDGMVCGHIHHAEIRDIDGVTYCNCGDWVESCTALVERHDGTMELLRWTEGLQVLTAESADWRQPLPAAASAMARAG
ncbi:MAG: UDP-2,3-diacylglucosamine diphosphatase [Thiohalocapsa sp.]|nr:UDP-2,3-diacylglucosamine diphosphatase [Thiohalocapsa sp.]MCF7988880.1 UDP-2,3-diacylglucosamine diphosphatase [Thiohalocapsa sp.]